MLKPSEEDFSKTQRINMHKNNPSQSSLVTHLKSEAVSVFALFGWVITDDWEGLFLYESIQCVFEKNPPHSAFKLDSPCAPSFQRSRIQ